MSALMGLKALLNNHRVDALITCEETCWCWAVESYIAEAEREAAELDTELVWLRFALETAKDILCEVEKLPLKYANLKHSAQDWLERRGKNRNER